ncbi:MAG: multicopper oxidase domain-containing protein [Microthrixaceae bacterium]
MTTDQSDPNPSGGEGAVSRRTVVGASVGGIGAAAAVGLTTAAIWPDTETAAAPASTAGSSNGSSGSADAGAGDSGTSGATIDFTAAPGDGWEARDPAAPPTPAETVHRIDIRATEIPGEVAPGVSQQLWTFDDTVPGKTYRGKLGDQFIFTLTNDGDIAHSIDFHASKVNWDGPMRSINPGESLEYAFEAKHAGIFMYHCGTPPVLHHIGAGMHGAVIIDPPDLAPVDHEFVMVQSEYYLGPEGEVGELSKMQKDQWDAVVFNGYVNQYQHSPIRVDVNQRIRIWVQDNGPSENSSFHVIGTIFDTVFKEGAYRLRPGSGQGGAQALDLQPAQGGFVEFTFDVEGFYPFVTHKFSSASIGALGLFQCGDVELPESAAGGH